MSGTAKNDVASASAAGSKKKKSTSKPAATTNGSVAIDSDTGMEDMCAFWGDTTTNTAKQGGSPSADVPSTAEQQTQQQPPSADPSTNEPWMMPGGNKDDDEKIPQLPIPVCTPAQAANTLTRKELEHLFIDTTFYARLGFLQAPSCLKCEYRDAHAGVHYRDTVAAKGCGRLVLWRKDTELPIHPDNMQTNSVVITCATAKALMRGEVVGGYRWDKNSQKMVCN